MKWGNISTTDAFDKMAGRVASDMEKEGAEKAAGDVAAKSIEGFSSDIMDKAVARSEDTLFTKVQKLFVKGLNILEDGVSRVTGKSFKFADSIGGKVLGSFTKDIAVKFAGPLTKAVAKAVAAEASAHLLDAVLLVWNLPTGAMEAAHIFKVEVS